jgi:hypothetical protein
MNVTNNIILVVGMATASNRRQYLPGELGAATSCMPSSEGAGRKRTPAIGHRAVLRPYLHGMETALTEAYRPKEGKPNLVRYADDVRHLTRYEILLSEKRGSEEMTSGSSHLPGRENGREKEHVRKAGSV